MQFIIAARVFMSATRALAGVITPIYLALLGFSGLQLGALFTVVALTSALLSAGVGLLSDRIGRKPFLVILPLFAGAAGIVFAFSHSFALIFVFAALGSFGRGAGAGAGMVGPYQPAEQALLAEGVTPRYRNSLFGRVAFASSLGALVGAPLAGLPNLLSGNAQHAPPGAYMPAFLVTAALAVVAGLLVLPITEQRRSRAPLHKDATLAAEGRTQRKPLVRLSRPTWAILLRLWVTNSFNGLAVGFFGPFITYWFYKRYGAGPAEVGLLYTVINLAAMVSNLGAAQLAARLGLVRAITWSRVLQAVLIIPMVLAPTFWLAGAFYLLRMMAQRVGLPLRQSYVMGVVPNDERGRVGALANLPSQATSAVSPTLAGYLFDHVALALPFEIGAILQGVNTLLFYLFFRSAPPPEERSRAPDPSPTGRAEADATAALTEH